MKYPSRTICVGKPIEQVKVCLASCASRYKSYRISNSDFLIFCSKRHNGGHLHFIKVTGVMNCINNQTEITMNAWPGLTFWLGCMVWLVGIVTLIMQAIARAFNPVPLLGATVLGALFAAVDYWEACWHLDRIEQRLTVADESDK